MSPLTTHVLDTSEGKPGVGIAVSVDRSLGINEWELVATGITNGDGRIPGLIPSERILTAGVYRLTFNVGSYYAALGRKTFYPTVQVICEITDAAAHYHVPLLLSPWGYSTYRGS